MKPSRRFKRKINKQIKKWNRIFERDPFYNNRFVLLEKQAFIHKYSDNSGYSAFCVYRIADKKLKVYRENCFNDFDIITPSHNFISFINEFITECFDMDKHIEHRDSSAPIDICPVITNYKNLGASVNISGKY